MFIFSWTIFTLTVTGNAVFNEIYRPLLRSSPATTQYEASDPFGKTIMKVHRQTSRTDSVLIVWPDGLSAPSLNLGLYWYAIVWGTYWLYPRSVTVTRHPEAALIAATDVVIDVRQFGQGAASVPSAYRLLWTDDYPNVNVGKDPAPDGYVSPGVSISVFSRHHG